MAKTGIAIAGVPAMDDTMRLTSLAIASIGLPLGVILGGDTNSIAPLRDQLEMAKAADDEHSQIEIIRRILEVDPDDTDLKEKLINLWLGVDDPAMAVESLKDWGDAPGALRVLAQAELLEPSQPREAAALFVEFLEKEPGNLLVTSALADLLFRQGESEQLLSLLKESKLTQKNSSLLLMRAVTRRAQGDYAGALDDFHAARTLNPEGAGVRSQAAAFERLETAIPHLNQAARSLEKSPDDFQSLVLRSYWSTFAGLPHKPALGDAEAAWEVDRVSAAARICAARASRLPQGEALEKFSANPSQDLNADSLNHLLSLDLACHDGDPANLLERSAFLTKALSQHLLGLQDARAVLATEPNNTSALLLELAALNSLGRSQEVAATFLTLESSSPTDSQLAEGLLILAEMQFGENHLEAANDAAGRSIELTPSSASYLLRAAIHERQGRIAKAASDRAKAATVKNDPFQ